MVASFCRCCRSSHHHQPVSIPFIAGQWSLLSSSSTCLGRTGSVSIPFIAGQWSLLLVYTTSNPVILMFQSPSLRGSGRFMEGPQSGSRGLRVSIPFIAGQWSLPAFTIGVTAAGLSFNPLHCGAVVASGLQLAFGHSPNVSFNPLHCGAVVASSSSNFCQ